MFNTAKFTVCASNEIKDKLSLQVFQGIRHEENEEQGEGGSNSIFSVLNQRLLEMGLPRWHLGGTVVEPIMSVGLVIILLLFGLPGVLFLGLLFIVSKLSQGQSLNGLWQNITGRGRVEEHTETTQMRRDLGGANNIGSSSQDGGSGGNARSNDGKFGGSGFRLGGR